MGKHYLEFGTVPDTQFGQNSQSATASKRLVKTAAVALLVLAFFYVGPVEDLFSRIWEVRGHRCLNHAYGIFPRPADPFHFLPCTDRTRPPAIDDPNPEQSWAKLYDPNPANWSWGKPSEDAHHDSSIDPYAGRGVFLCGYLDVPMDYTNESDSRISRQAVTKFQVSGLRRLDGSSLPAAGHKSSRTLVVEPGGPGGGGQAMVWGNAESISKRWSNNTIDVLGWDPRGVNATYPAISCFASDAHRDRWRMVTNKNRRLLGENGTIQQLQVADAMNDAMFQYCFKKYGDLPRFMTTAFVARDLENIRQALGEDELTGFMVSYGTGIAQTYAGMFPDSVGRIILDGNEVFSDYKDVITFASNTFDNVTDAWRDGFLANCVNAGPDGCPLANSRTGEGNVTLKSLEARMDTLLASLAERPLPAYSEKSGPGLITYQFVLDAIFESMYGSGAWPGLAGLLNDLESKNTTKALERMNKGWWASDPGAPFTEMRPPTNDELVTMVICPEGYDQPHPESLEVWDAAWQNATDASWISGDMRIYFVFPCRQFYKYWPTPAEVYRGGLDKQLKNPLLLISESYDPATPLRHARRLHEMIGRENSRLVVHHGFGHGSHGNPSDCTDAIGRKYILEGILPSDDETHCDANDKPFSAARNNIMSETGMVWNLKTGGY